MNLQQLRTKINKIDRAVIGLLAQRQALMPLVAKYKKQNGLSIHQVGRERNILNSLTALAKKKRLDPVVTKKIFKELFKSSKKIQRETLGQS